jgi:hypothetical protein
MLRAQVPFSGVVPEEVDEFEDAPHVESVPDDEKTSQLDRNPLPWRLQMDKSQILTIALAALPNMLAVLAGILINNSRLSDTNTRISELRGHIDIRFNEMRDLWRSELYRVEQVIDARLKHLEERG